jgi:hypothetical protein
MGCYEQSISRNDHFVLTIECSFDEEFGPVGMDPLGKIAIADEHSQILIENTYLDSWLAALIDTLHRLSTIGRVSLETEERDSMEIEAAPDGNIAISYRDQKLTAKSRRELELALRSAVNAFLEEIKLCPDVSQNRIIDPIRRFWATTEN